MPAVGEYGRRAIIRGSLLVKQARPGPLNHFSVGHLCQRNLIQQLHEPTLYLEQALTLKSGERSTNGFQLEPEVAPDFLARQAQHEFAGRKSARLIPAGQVEQEYREPLVGTHRSQYKR